VGFAAARGRPDNLRREVSASGTSVLATKIERMPDRPFFQPEQAPRGVYRGKLCDVVYDLAPVPCNEQWIAEFRKLLVNELERIPGLKRDRSFLDSLAEENSLVVAPDPDGTKIVCTITVRTSVTAEQLVSVDDAVSYALKFASQAVDQADAELEDKLAHVRQRRADSVASAVQR
jgi:hypothetical protein